MHIFTLCNQCCLRPVTHTDKTKASGHINPIESAQILITYETNSAQVGLIKSTEVEIQNKLSDQSEVRKGEDKKLRHWTKEAAKKRTELTAAFPEGTHCTMSHHTLCPRP